MNSLFYPKLMVLPKAIRKNGARYASSCGKERKSRLPEIVWNYTYDADVKVSNTDLYDVAS
jgi:hypothetical protein